MNSSSKKNLQHIIIVAVFGIGIMLCHYSIENLLPRVISSIVLAVAASAYIFYYSRKGLLHIVAIATFLIVAVFYGKPALEEKVVQQSDIIGWKGTAQQSELFKDKYGHYPLWTNSQFSGMPAYTIDMEPTLRPATTVHFFYLITLNLPKPISLFFLTSICFYILTQVLRINPWLGILGALSYAYATFNPILVAVGHDTELFAIGYMPMVIASVLLIYQRKYWTGSILLTIFFGYILTTQHAQVIYYTSIILLFVTVAFLIYSYKQKDIKNALISVCIAIVAGILGFGTFAISWMPLQEYSKETMRGGKTDLTNVDPKVKKQSGLTKDYAFQWSYGIPETFTLIVPGIYGGGSDGKQITGNSKFAEKASEIGMPEENAIQYVNGALYWGAQELGTSGPVYLGAVICFLFILGMVYVKSWHKWWILSAAILGILMAWGKSFSMFNYFLFDYLPFYNKFRAPTIALVMPQLVFPLLAVLGLQQLLFTKEEKQIVWQKLKPVAYITAGLLVILAVMYFTSDYKGSTDTRLKESLSNQLLQSAGRGKQPTPEMQQQVNETTTGLIKGLQADRQSLFGADLIRSTLLIILAALLIGLFLKDKIKPVVVIAGLILLSGYDLLAEGRVYLNDDNFLEPADFESAFNPTPADIQINKDPEQNFRVFDPGAEQGWSQDSHVSYYHNSIGGYSPAKLGLYQDLIENQLMKGNLMVINMLNTKYIIQRNPQNGQKVAMINQNAFGPCWLVKNIHYVKNGDEEMKALDSINVRDTAIVQQKYESMIKFLPQYDSTASLTLVDNKNDIVDYKFSSKTNQFAVFSEVYYDKGWNAYIDGNKADYVKVNYILRGMAVPAGDHTIQFRFEPAVFKLSNTITVLCSIVAYILLIAAIVMAWRKKGELV